MSKAISSKAELKALLLEDLKDFWEECVKCPIGELAYRHVIYEAVPDDSAEIGVMFIGEGPGISEDTLGRPFIGVAGRFLRDDVVALVNKHNVPIVYTNLVACRPCDTKNGPNRTPSDLEVIKCRTRLIKLMHIFQPKVVVALGQVPGSYIDFYVNEAGLNTVVFKEYHPSHLARSGGKECSKYIAYLQKMEQIFDIAHRKLNEKKTIKKFKPVRRKVHV